MDGGVDGVEGVGEPRASFGDHAGELVAGADAAPVPGGLLVDVEIGAADAAGGDVEAHPVVGQRRRLDVDDGEAVVGIAGLSHGTPPGFSSSGVVGDSTGRHTTRAT